MQIIWFLILATLATKLLTHRWPWQWANLLTGSPGLRQARALLGVTQHANRVEIIEAHRRLVAMVHPDRGGTSEQVIEANAARDLLLGALVERPGGE